LRAVSFLIVFFAHSWSPLPLPIPGGFGVTVFFYLSGFLITTLLRQEVMATGTVDFSTFYLRRVLRILPPFYIVLALACGLTVLRVLPGELNRAVVLAQSLHYSNYWFASHGYAGAPLGTVVYWSLAVEEHFYLLFPLVYLALTRTLSRRQQGVALWALCAAVCAWRCVLVLAYGVPEDRTYMASDTRFDSIIFGCALAVAMNPVLDPQRGSERLWKWLLLPAGLALLLVTFLWRPPWFRETIRYTLQGIGLTPLFVTAIRFPRWRLFRPLNWRLVAHFGVLTYSLYLVHQIVLYATGAYLKDYPAPMATALALGLSVLIALALHHVVERPCADLRRRLSRAEAIPQSRPLSQSIQVAIGATTGHPAPTGRQG